MDALLDKVARTRAQAPLIFRGADQSSSSLSNIVGVGAAIGLSEEESQLYNQLDAESFDPDAFSTVFSALWMEISNKYPAKTELLRSKLAATLKMPADTQPATIFERVRSWGAEHKALCITVLAIAGAVIGAAVFWKWWKSHKATGSNLGVAITSIEGSGGRQLVSMLEKMAGANAGDMNPDTVRGQVVDMSRVHQEMEAENAIKFLRTYFGNVDTVRAVYIALHGLELQDFEMYKLRYPGM